MEIFFFFDENKRAYISEAIETLARQTGFDRKRKNRNENYSNEQINLNLYKIVEDAKDFYRENLQTI